MADTILHRHQRLDAATPSVITEAELARRWGLSRRTLQTWRARHCSPAWLRLGGRVLYRIEDVAAFEAANRHEGGA